MPEDPFERAREEMERAQRDFHDHMRRAQQELGRALDAGRQWIAAVSAEFQERLEAARRGTNPPRRQPPRRGGRPKRRGPGPGGPQPSPVRPPDPSFLSGGAEAPLDE